MQSVLREIDHNEHALLLSLSGIKLALPDIMVEEVFWPQHVQGVDSSPDWFLGYFDWSGKRLPLISFEIMNGSHGREFLEGKSVAIINGSLNHRYLPYYALLLEDKTQMVPLNKKSIAPEFGHQTMRAEACWIKVDSEIAVIPKVEWIEEHLLAYVLNR